MMAPERQSMEVDIVGVGFGPATAGFLTTLTRGLLNEDGTPKVESRIMPGMPPQVICYERADDIGFGVSGVVTHGRGIKDSFPELNINEIPMAAKVAKEEVVYLLDPHGASRRSGLLKFSDKIIRSLGAFSSLPGMNFLQALFPYRDYALRLPYIPPFLRKHEGFVFSIGQLCQWVGSQVIGSGTAQIWPGMPVSEPLIEDGKVVGVRLVDQGTDKSGAPSDGYMPGMDIRAALTVVGDGPVGVVGRKLDDVFGMPEGNHKHEWAVGSKMVVSLPEGTPLKQGMVIHTFGYPEPEIFGFLYVHPDNIASFGIFVPSFFGNPARTSYRYLQHWMRHPYLWKYLEGAELRSWGAKSLQESGVLGEPFLVGDGYARIGEGSGSTNMLTGSGVDEAWTTGVQLAEGVLELLQQGKEFSKENLEHAYVSRRRKSWVERECKIAKRARAGFQRGFIQGLLGMGLVGFSRGRLAFSDKSRPVYQQLETLEQFYSSKLSSLDIQAAREASREKNTPLYEELMRRAGWPDIPFDGKLLVSQQDALLIGGKVQAPGGYADHLVFVHPELCERCEDKLCIEICSGQAIAPGEGHVPSFDREKCVYCGACLWNCTQPLPEDPMRTNIAFGTGAGGFHSSEN